MATLGVDLGGTNVRAAVVDGKGAVVAEARRAHGGGTPEAVAGVIAEVIREATAKVPLVPVYGVGVGIAAQVNADTGIVEVAPNLGWRDVPFAQVLSDRLGRNVVLLNDLSAAAWGEFRAGAGVGAQELLVVAVGTGVGAAIISGGALFRGAGGVAAELGHVKVVPGGRRCGCGDDGCVEAYAGGVSLKQQLREALEESRGTGLSEFVARSGRSLEGSLLEEAAAAGDPVAQVILQRAGSLLGLAVANQITMLNPERLILGGGTLHHLPSLRRAIITGVRAYATRSSLAHLTIVDAQLGDRSGLVGAALLAA